MHEAIDQHYGPEIAQARQRANLILLVSKVLIFLVIGIISIAFAIFQRNNSDDAGKDDGDTSEKDVDRISGVVVILVSVAGVIRAGFVYAGSPGSGAEELKKQASKPDFRNQLGYMDSIKKVSASIPSSMSCVASPRANCIFSISHRFTGGS